MNYTLMPSLELRALVKTVITLWNQDDIKTLVASFDFILLTSKGGNYEEWQQVENKVFEKIKDLPLPESLKRNASDYIKSIGFEIVRWWIYHDVSLRLSRDKRLHIETLNNLCWTPEGTIDKKKTAEALIRDENLDITDRYKLACTYCFENDILTLLNNMPEESRKSFYSREVPISLTQRELVNFWTYCLKGELTRLDSIIEGWYVCTPYQYAFECAASSGNKVATEFFFPKLTSVEREHSLTRTAGRVCMYYLYERFGHDYPGVLCFLLSQMNEEQQIELFTKHPYSVLRCFLCWPCQVFFMETANRIWALLPEKNYLPLLNSILKRIVRGSKDYDYQKLLREFWQKSPITHKEYVIDQCVNVTFLKNLLQTKDKEFIKLFFKNATIPAREKIIFSDRGKSTCEMLIYNDEMDLLEFFVQECLSSKDMMSKFREEFTAIYSEEAPEKEKDMLFKLHQLINDLISRADKKRFVEEGNSGSI